MTIKKGLFMSRNQAGNSVITALVGLLVLAGVAAAGYAVWAHQYKPTASNQTSASQTGTASKTSTPTTSTTTASTDVSALTNDLNGVGSSLAKENTDQSGTNSAINDQQNEIQVPTN
jgi:hypothetical protein